VLELNHSTHGNKRGHVQCKLRDIRNNRLMDHKFRAEDDVERAILDEHEMQFLYREGDLFYFMNTETYEQVHLSLEVLGESALYLLPDSVITVEFYDVEPVGIQPRVQARVERMSRRDRQVRRGDPQRRLLGVAGAHGHSSQCRGRDRSCRSLWGSNSGPRATFTTGS
jgi:translation elongation factor P/translation initiation factor 5A